MLAILSPAKTLDFESPLPAGLEPTRPRFLDEAEKLVASLQTYDPEALAELMSISPRLAALTHERFEVWRRAHTARNARPALFAFAGDVYEGLEAGTLDGPAMAGAQAHLRILSGLYGCLRPLDRIQAHRLEMGTKIEPEPGRRLAEFWKPRVTAALNDALERGGHAGLVNLASNEYAAAVDFRQLCRPSIRIVFQEARGSKRRTLAIHAKKARGLMARWIAMERPRDVEALRAFGEAGYRFEAALSDAETFYFVRPQPLPRSSRS